MTSHDQTTRDRNPAQVRGDIDQGRTGDKIEGIDPAAAPYETDSEAGGTPLTGSQTAATGARRPQPVPGGAQLAHGSAMRPFDQAQTGWGSGPVWIAAIAALVVVAAVLVFAAS
jgi:hypothetical protein